MFFTFIIKFSGAKLRKIIIICNSKKQEIPPLWEWEILIIFKSIFTMVNYNFQAGKLIKDAIREVNVSHRSISMTEVLIGSGVVGSDSALSWIRNGETKDLMRYVVVMNEVTKRLPSNRLVYYRLKMFDILVKAAEAKAQKGRHNSIKIDCVCRGWW